MVAVTTSSNVLGRLCFTPNVVPIVGGRSVVQAAPSPLRTGRGSPYPLASSNRRRTPPSPPLPSSSEFGTQLGSGSACSVVRTSRQAP